MVHRITIFLFTGIVCSASLNAQTTISGDIHNHKFDTTGSPYLVVSDIVVPSGTECWIEKGVVFLFRPFTGLIVDGRLLVNGTPDQPVTFTSANNFLYNMNSMQPPQAFDWNGIIIASESYGSILRHITLSYSVYGIAAKTPNISIEKGLFFDNGQFHVTIKDKMQNVKNNVPFTYQSKLMETIRYSNTSSPSKPSRNNTSTGGIRKRPVFRYSLLGAGVLATAAGVGGAVMAFENTKNIEAMGPDKINPATDTYYRSSDKAIKDEKKLLDRNTAGSIAGFIIGILGVSGFTLTFFF